jgi:disulfide bond formation protein DsbB
MLVLLPVMAWCMLYRLRTGVHRVVFALAILEHQHHHIALCLHQVHHSCCWINESHAQLFVLAAGMCSASSLTMHCSPKPARRSSLQWGLLGLGSPQMLAYTAVAVAAVAAVGWGQAVQQGRQQHGYGGTLLS